MNFLDTVIYFGDSMFRTGLLVQTDKTLFEVASAKGLGWRLMEEFHRTKTAGPSTSQGWWGWDPRRVTLCRAVCTRPSGLCLVRTSAPPVLCSQGTAHALHVWARQPRSPCCRPHARGRTSRWRGQPAWPVPFICPAGPREPPAAASWGSCLPATQSVWAHAVQDTWKIGAALPGGWAQLVF